MIECVCNDVYGLEVWRTHKCYKHLLSQRTFISYRVLLLNQITGSDASVATAA
jgi:hypothetical protein